MLSTWFFLFLKTVVSDGLVKYDKCVKASPRRRIENMRCDFLPLNQQSTITAKVILQLNDGTIIESDAYSTTLRAIFEIININYKDFSSNQLSLISEWIQRHPVIKKWYVDNLVK